MKVIKTKKDKITLNEILDKFDDLIVVADNTDYAEEEIYILIFCGDRFYWRDIKTNGVWDESNNLSQALQYIDIGDLYAFESYKKFGEWLSNKGE